MEKGVRWEWLRLRRTAYFWRCLAHKFINHHSAPDDVMKTSSMSGSFINHHPFPRHKTLSPAEMYSYSLVLLAGDPACLPDHNSMSNDALFPSLKQRFPSSLRRAVDEEAGVKKVNNRHSASSPSQLRSGLLGRSGRTT